MIIIRRSLKAVLYASFEIIVAALLLNYSLKWFLLYFFMYFIYRTCALYEASRATSRYWQASNDLKLLALMHKMNISPEEAERMFSEHMESTLSESEQRALAEDFSIAKGQG
jgi:hypothetical protein